MTMVSSTFIKHFIKPSFLRWEKSHGLSPYLIVLHAEVDKHIRCDLSDAFYHMAIEGDSKGFEIPHFVVQAGDELSVHNFGVRKALLDNGFQ